MEPLTAFVLLGLAAWFLIVVIGVSCETGVPGVLATVGLVCLAQLAWSMDPLGYVWHHPGNVIAIAAGYVVIGVVWSLLRWVVYCRTRADRYMEEKTKFLRQYNATELTDSLRVKWREQVYGYRTDGNEIAPPKASENKAMIIRWMGWWWASMLDSMFHGAIRLVRDLFRGIYVWLGNTYQRLSDRIFADFHDDLKRDK